MMRLSRAVTSKVGRNIALTTKTGKIAYLLSLAGWPKCVGLALVGVAFLGQARRRRRVLRVAAWAFAAALAWIYSVRTLESFGLLGFPFGEGRMIFGHALAILSYLLTLMGVVLVAWAFAPRNDHGQRDGWLGWGAAAAAAGGAAALLYYALTPWQSASDIIPFNWARVFSMGDFFFWTLAFGTAAWAFFLSARSSASPAYSRFAGREGLLALACVWLCLSYTGTLVGVFAEFLPMMDEDLGFVFGPTTLLRALGAVAEIAGAALAAVAFSRSRRSFRR
jgi:hypothetical protein